MDAAGIRFAVTPIRGVALWTRSNVILTHPFPRGEIMAPPLPELGALTRGAHCLATTSSLASIKSATRLAAVDYQLSPKHIATARPERAPQQGRLRLCVHKVDVASRLTEGLDGPTEVTRRSPLEVAG